MDNRYLEQPRCGIRPGRDLPFPIWFFWHGQRTFNTPLGIAFDSAGNIWVTDWANHNIQEFSATGTYLATFGSRGIGSGQYLDPMGIAIVQTPPPPPPTGTVLWTNSGDGSGFASIIPAVPASTGVADIFGFQNDGTVAAITSAGNTAWTASVNINESCVTLNPAIPDFQGGLVASLCAGNGGGTNSVYKLDGITGQPYPAYTWSTTGSFPYSHVAVHTDGTIFVETVSGQRAQDGGDFVTATIAAIDPTTGSQNFSVDVPLGETATVGGLIIAGDGYLYMPFAYRDAACGNDCQTEANHVKLFRINSAGANDTIDIKDWTSPAGDFVPANYFIITNADTGVLLSVSDNESFYFAVTTGTSVSIANAQLLPDQTILGGSSPGSPINPVLQREDGSFVGTQQSNMVAFTASGSVLWTVSNDKPQIATSDGGVIGQSGIIYDQNGNITGQTATLPIYSWTGNAYQQQQGSVEQISAGLLFVLYDLASSFWPIVGGNYSGNETAYALIRTFSDNEVDADIVVMNPSQANPNQQTITNVLNDILQALNSGNYGGCSAWLTGAAPFSISTYINTLLTQNGYWHGSFNDNGTAAFAGGKNGDGTLAGVPVSAAFTVNDQGAFFNANLGDKALTVGRRSYMGNTLKAQATILIHELGHLMNESNGAAGFQLDAGNKQAGRANDKLVDTNCGSLIKSLK